MNPVGDFGNETAKSLPVCKSKPFDFLRVNPYREFMFSVACPELVEG